MLCRWIDDSNSWIDFQQDLMPMHWKMIEREQLKKDNSKWSIPDSRRRTIITEL